MNIHEYQAKQLLKKYGVAVNNGMVAHTPEEAESVARTLGGSLFVVKAQIHAGGRGKGKFKEPEAGDKGGVRLVQTPVDVRAHAAQMLGKTLVTHQTGAVGRTVKRLYIEAGCDVARELYLSMLIDRSASCLTIIASTAGGMEIEKVAAETPEKIIKVPIDPISGIQPFHARKVAFGLRLEGKQIRACTNFVMSMYHAFMELDASLIEINPLVVTPAGDVIALDAKMTFDDNALFRHKEVREMRDEDEEDARELEAARHSLNYITLDGTIGCMVNGAGLAMATMDIIKLYGASPANFLDVGGGATKERVTVAFKLILSDSNVKGILVNIFGGIMRCDIIAEGVVAAAREVDLHVPLVVRLEGTNVDSGKKTIHGSGLPIITANNLADAAEKVVKAVKEAA